MPDRDRQREQHLQAMSLLEQDFLKQVMRALTEFLRRASDAVLGMFRRFRVQPDPLGVWTAQPVWNTRVDEMISDLEKVAAAGWENATENPYTSTNSFVQSQLSMARNLLVRIPEEVFQLVSAEITDGITDGDDLDEIAARVDRVLSITGSARWTNRAQVIAQTEVLRAYNSGAYAAAIADEYQLNVRLAKVWLATEDRRTRPSHRRADGQTRLLNEPFLVGGSSMLFPGDPMAPPEEVINCRCALVVEEVADGRR